MRQKFINKNIKINDVIGTISPRLAAGSNGGYIALISTIIISFVLMAITFGTSASGFFSRFDALNSEFKRVSLGLAESCVNQALLRLAQNYNYDPASDPLFDSSKGGVPVAVGTDTCLVEPFFKAPVETTDPLTLHKNKKVFIATKAQYHGAFSNVQVSSVVQDPSSGQVLRATVTVVVNVNNSYGGTKQAANFTVHVSAANPSQSLFSGAGGSGTVINVDSGNFTVTQDSMSGYSAPTYSSGCSQLAIAGQNYTCIIGDNDVVTTATLTVTAQITNGYGGTLAPTGITLNLDGTQVFSGDPNSGLMPGTHTVLYSNVPAGYTVSWTGSQPSDCSTGGTVNLSPGNSKNCIIFVTQNPPPAPRCADTVMMLDRTGSMFGIPHSPGWEQFIPDEKTAAKALLNLYSAVTPAPQVGIGRFSDDSKQNADIVAHLTDSYTGLSAAIDSALVNISTVSSPAFTNLADAVSKGYGELNSAQHKNGFKKVLIIISDGKPTKPSGNASSDATSALNAADLAKTSKGPANDYYTEIFTIHFGDASGRNLLAQLASGTTANSGHQPGSKNDAGTTGDLSFINAENNDGDNFYISPTSADMAKIFTDIGKKVCPETVIPPPAPPTTGTLYVITHVVNDNGGTKAASDFTVTVTGGNPLPNVFSGTEAPGAVVTINPAISSSYSVSESPDSGYVKNMGSQCSGNIAAGQTVTCTIIDDDIPPPQPPAPPPPPPQSNISLDTWMEK